jgi:hypothetical protein
MTTVDNLLINIITKPDDYAKNLFPKKDFDILTNLHKSIVANFFITENQGRLLIKILKENQKKLTEFSDEITTAITSPTWSRSFRFVEQVKKLYIEKNSQDEPVLTAEFTFSSQIRKVFTDLSKTCENVAVSNTGKKYWADLTEKNIVKFVEALKPLNFDIDETVKNYYNVIKSWSENDIFNQFLIPSMPGQNFQKHITADLGIETAIDDNIIVDRSMRYQYTLENPKKVGESLVEIIANRNRTKIWISKSEYDLASVIASLIKLRRFPLLVVFDTFIDMKYLENLETLSDALEKNGIFEDIGVYFRLPNDEVGKKFNQLIKEKSYNKNLDQNTKVAVVMSGKLPKFFLKNPWQPMSVIALDTKMGLRHGKTSVYSNCCDLIVEWADKEVMFENKVIGKWQ